MGNTKWFQDARFGLFIHGGLYSIPAKVKGGIIWVMPIHQGVIKSHPQSFCTKSVQILAH